MTQGRSSRIFPTLIGLDFNWSFGLDVGFQVFGLGLVFRFFSGFGLVFLRTWLGFLDIDIGLM